MKRFKTALLAGTIAGISTAALAADIAPAGGQSKTTAAVPYSWTSFYAEGDVGYGWGGNGLDLKTVPASSFGVDAGLAPHGVTLGGGLGYDYQMGTSVVLGAVADISWSDINDSSAIISAPGFSVNDSAKLNWFGTVRGRAGYLLTPALLLYGTAGGAYGGASATGSINTTGGSASLTANGTNFGWTAGAGAEYAFSNAWHLKAEWLHLDLGSISACAAVGKPGSGNCIGFSNKVTDDVYRVGVNYRF